MGLWAGLAVVVTGLSGSAIVFRDAWEREANGMPAAVEAAGRLPLGLQAAYERVLAASPGASIVVWNLPVAAGGIHQVVLAGGGFVAVDPYTGSILGPLRGRKTWLTWASRVHFTFLWHRNAAGASAVLMIVLALSGMVAWLRGSRSWHTQLGMASAPLLLLFGLSGAWFVWARPAGLTPPVAPAGGPLGNLDSLVAAAQAQLPGGRPTYLTFPSRWQSVLSVRFHLPGELRATGSSTVHLNPASGEVVRVDRFADAPRALRWYTIASAVHFGEFGGDGLRAVWMVLGAVPLILWLSGVRWQGRGGRRS